MTNAEATRALIVDDDPVVARSIARCLLREGYLVSLAKTCAGARALDPGFHVAILDLDLPDGSGVDLADELLRLGSVRGIVFYTGSLNEALRNRALSFGSVVDKARELEEVVRAVDQVPGAAPISHYGPAQRRRRRPSSSRLTRLAPTPGADSANVTPKRSSRR
jgi:DNA-binding response OmpR family regulator